MRLCEAADQSTRSRLQHSTDDGQRPDVCVGFYPLTARPDSRAAITAMPPPARAPSNLRRPSTPGRIRLAVMCLPPCNKCRARRGQRRGPYRLHTIPAPRTRSLPVRDRVGRRLCLVVALMAAALAAVAGARQPGPCRAAALGGLRGRTRGRHRPRARAERGVRACHRVPPSGDRRDRDTRRGHAGHVVRPGAAARAVPVVRPRASGGPTRAADRTRAVSASRFISLGRSADSRLRVERRVAARIR